MQAQNFQFDANRIANTLAEIERQKERKIDYVYPLARLGFTDDGQLVFEATQKGLKVHDRVFSEWTDAEAYLEGARAAKVDGADDWTIEVVDGAPALPLSPTAIQQLLFRLSVPGKFYNYLMGSSNNDLAGHVMRELLHRDGRSALVRTLDGKVRAVLSDRYKVLDNADLFYCAADAFRKDKAMIWNARLHDDGFEMFGVAPHIASEVRLDRPFDPGDGWQSRWYGQSGDPHNAAVRISNSETGRGGLNVDFCIMRRVCANFCVWTDGVSTIHAGGRLKVDEGRLIISEETRQKEGELLWSTIKDAIHTAFDEQRFNEYIDQLNAATQVHVPEVKIAVDNVASAYAIDESRKLAILAEIMMSGDRSQFGLVQAVTHAAHDADAPTAHQLEEVGAELVSMESRKFRQLVEA